MCYYESANVYFTIGNNSQFKLAFSRKLKLIFYVKLIVFIYSKYCHKFVNRINFCGNNGCIHKNSK